MARSITNIRVVQEDYGRLDESRGEWGKPRWSLLFNRGETPCKRQVACGGESRPLGRDLEEAAKGLGLSFDQLMDIPVVPLTR